jgi:hypothetical protein
MQGLACMLGILCHISCAAKFNALALMVHAPREASLTKRVAAWSGHWLVQQLATQRAVKFICVGLHLPL